MIHYEKQDQQVHIQILTFSVVFFLFFFTYIPCSILILSFFYSATDTQANCLKISFDIYLKIDIRTAPTCFGAVTPSSGSALLVLAKVTVVKIAN
jgi:hypothetical protein